MYTSVVFKGNIKSILKNLQIAYKLHVLDELSVGLHVENLVFVTTQVTPFINFLLVTKKIQRQTQHFSQGGADTQIKCEYKIYYKVKL